MRRSYAPRRSTRSRRERPRPPRAATSRGRRRHRRAGHRAGAGSRHPGAESSCSSASERIAAHQSGHSSGVIHAGIYYAPGSLKARLCVEGARRLYAYCDERGIQAQRDGKVIVATEPSELPRLDELERRGPPTASRACAGSGREELARDRAARGAASPRSTRRRPGSSTSQGRRRATPPTSRGAGGAFDTGCEVRALATRRAGGSRSSTQGGTLDAGRAVLCAGPWADRLAVAAGAGPDPRIVPFRGAYLRLRPSARDSLVRASIYPVPDPDLPFLGMHLTRNARRRGAARADGAVRRRPRRLPPAAASCRATCSRASAWPGHLADDAALSGAPALVEIRHAASAVALRRRVPALRARAPARRRRAQRPRRRPRPGGRPGRLAGRRLRRLRDRSRDPRPQRPLPRRHLVAGAGAS